MENQEQTIEEDLKKQPEKEEHDEEANDFVTPAKRLHLTRSTVKEREGKDEDDEDDDKNKEKDAIDDEDSTEVVFRIKEISYPVNDSLTIETGLDKFNGFDYSYFRFVKELLGREPFIFEIKSNLIKKTCTVLHQMKAAMPKWAKKEYKEVNSI